MVTKDMQVDEFLKLHNGDARSLAAWAIGYIEKLERERIDAGKALGFCDHGDTFSDVLNKNALKNT